MSICESCAKEKCFHRSSLNVGCSNYVKKAQTNADCIRAMTDEELARLIVKHKPVYSWCKGVREIWMQPNVTKEQAWVKWLQQPAREGE